MSVATVTATRTTLRLSSTSGALHSLSCDTQTDTHVGKRGSDRKIKKRKTKKKTRTKREKLTTETKAAFGLSK